MVYTFLTFLICCVSQVEGHSAETESTELVGGFHVHTGWPGRSALGKEFASDSPQEAREGKSGPGRGGEVQRP